MRRSVSLAALALPLALGACSAGQEAAAEDTLQATSAPAELEVRASDFAFAMPDTVAAGATRIRLVNDGPDLHHVYVVRLEDGHTLEELGQAMAAAPHGAPPAWMVDVGGPNTPLPGAEAVATVDLTPGRYAVLCVIPSADGVPHVMKGMAKELTVMPATGTPAPMPAAELTMRLDDYAFGLSAPITAGRHTIRVENAAAQPHEVLFVKLAPGKTMADFLRFLEKPEGTPPGAPMGGTTGIAQGGVNVVEIDFTPGDWALICFFPDAKDGKPHFVHGMMQQFEVKAKA